MELLDITNDETTSNTWSSAIFQYSPDRYQQHEGIGNIRICTSRSFTGGNHEWFLQVKIKILNKNYFSERTSIFPVDEKYEIEIKLCSSSFDFIKIPIICHLSILCCSSHTCKNKYKISSSSTTGILKSDPKFKFWSLPTELFLACGLDCLTLDGKLIISTNLKNQKKPMADHSFEGFNFELQKLLTDASFSDIKIQCQGEVFDAHKCILALKSPVFKTMLEIEMKEKLDNVITITDCSAEIFRQILVFMYTGKIEIKQSNVKEIFSIAEQYDIEKLKILCGEYLWPEVSMENFKEYLNFANLHNIKTLKNKIKDVIVCNVFKIEKNALVLLSDEEFNFLAQIIERIKTDH